MGDVWFAYTILVGKREWRKPLGDTCAYRHGDNIKILFQKKNIYNLNVWIIAILQDRSQYKVLVTTVIFVPGLLLR